MSQRLLFPLLLLFAVALACGLVEPEGGEPPATDPNAGPAIATRVTAVSVEPASARLGEPYAVGVAYTRGTDTVDTLTCSLPPNDQPGTLFISLDLTDVSAGPQTWAFTVVSNAAGNYYITCQAIGQGDTVTAGLTVEGEPTGQNEQPEFSQATLNLRWDTAVATKGDKINIFTCSTVQLDVSPDGLLTGMCNTITGNQDQSPITGELSGQWNRQTGQITFHMQTNMTVSGSADASKQAQWAVTVDTATSGGFVAETQATGSATWTNTCDAHPDISCYDLTTHKEAAGEVQWVIEFAE